MELATVPCPKGYHAVPCDSSAHDSAFNDTCTRCAPLWGVVLVPVGFCSAQAFRDALADADPSDRAGMVRRRRNATRRYSDAKARAYREWAFEREDRRALRMAGEYVDEARRVPGPALASWAHAVCALLSALL